MRRILSRIREALTKPREMPRVEWDEEGFSVNEDEKLVVRVRWQDILEIFAYKEDLFAYDEICLGFRVGEDGKDYMVSEHFIGYRKFLAELERRFHGFRMDWFAEVAFPAFAPNRTTLWEPVRV